MVLGRLFSQLKRQSHTGNPALCYLTCLEALGILFLAPLLISKQTCSWPVRSPVFVSPLPTVLSLLRLLQDILPPSTSCG